MKRETVNTIRYLLDSFLPKILRDSFLVKSLMYLVFGKRTKVIIDFRKNAKSMSREDYQKVYKDFKPISTESDLTQKTIEEILKEIAVGRVLDVGAGNGYLASIIEKQKDLKVWKCDIHDEGSGDENYKVGFIENLPFEDNEFETVICTHVLEHIADFNRACMEIRRVCKSKVIFVVPMEAEFSFGFNLHLNFFPYPHSFLNRIPWDTSNSKIKVIDGDLFFTQEFN